ncbi:MAG: hypothetical protein HQL64_07175 [Magnetococcales bacterium]|nr:hypothetical protein [Magnetococcales bacterium]
MDTQLPTFPPFNPAANRSYQATQGGISSAPGADRSAAMTGSHVRDRVSIGSADIVTRTNDQLANQSLAKVLHAKVPVGGHTTPLSVPVHIDIMV